MSNHYEALKEKLHELFQMDQADLDFGIYRIMNTKREEITRYLNEALPLQVEEALKPLTTGETAEIKKQMSQLEQDAQKFAGDPQKNPEYRDLAQQLSDNTDVSSIEKGIFSDLYTFFSRYYEDGDFLSRRRYKEGVYAIPYEGEEVKLHWANSDQYYIKTAEYFTNYRFRLTGSGKVVRFCIENGSTEQNNNKEGRGKERRFLLLEESPVIFGEDELVVRFEYRAETSDSTQESSKKKSRTQAEINTSIVALMRGEIQLDEFAELFEGEEKDGDKCLDKCLLERHLCRYTARNQFDYFIHKDLGSFLRRELDFFLKNEVLVLGDILAGDGGMVTRRFTKLRVIKQIAEKIIRFLAQLEDFQKRLWLKKKFVVETNWCVTLDRVSEELYDEIVTNEAQREEWIKLFAIDEIKNDLANGVGYSMPLKKEFLKSQPCLVLDTAFFNEDFKQRLVSGIEDLDERTDGLLIHSENFQALNLLQEKYQESIQTTYIDPPYNTDANPILYKDQYKHSSWLTLVHSRFEATQNLLKSYGTIFVSIDDNEMHRLRFVMSEIFGERNFCENFIWNNTSTPPSLSKISRKNVEYVLCYAKNINEVSKFFGRFISDLDAALINSGNKIRILNFPAGTVKFNISDGTYEAGFKEEKIELVTKLIVENNFNKNNFSLKAEFSWKQETLDKEISKKTHFIVKSEKFSIRYQREESGRFMSPDKYFDNEFLDKKVGVGTNEESRKSLENIGVNFNYPKPVTLIKYFLRTISQKDSVILDYFAGSATTGHAVLNLNREDNGERKYILVEMGEYFDTVTKPRMQKVIYSKDWKDGKPVSRQGSSHAFKYIRLESYEDTLNNLTLTRDKAIDSLLESKESKEQYLLSYMLDTESRESLLPLSKFDKPFDYQLSITRDSETRKTPIDMVETFNYLIGLTVSHQSHVRRFAAEFSRNQDDKLTIKGQLQESKNEESKNGESKNRESKNGRFLYRTIKGKTRTDEQVLVIWRERNLAVQQITDKTLEEDDVALNAFLRILPQEDLVTYDTIYVNGDNTLMNTRKETETWKAHLIEEAFHRLMFS